jgi:hypothetical protein
MVRLAGSKAISFAPTQYFKGQKRTNDSSSEAREAASIGSESQAITKPVTMPIANFIVKILDQMIGLWIHVIFSDKPQFLQDNQKASNPDRDCHKDDVE